MRLNLIALAAIVASVAADGSAIITAINAITASTDSFNQVVNSWDGTPLDLLRVNVASTKVLNEIHDGRRAAAASDPLTGDEAIQVAGLTQTLAAAVDTVISSLIANKPRFDKIVLASSIVELNLKQQQQATDEFSGVLLTKVPAQLQAAAIGLTTPIDTSFSRGIVAFSH